MISLHSTESRLQYISVSNNSSLLVILYRQLPANSSTSAKSYSLPGIAICYIRAYSVSGHQPELALTPKPYLDVAELA
jgi:hypothetical protein